MAERQEGEEKEHLLMDHADQSRNALGRAAAAGGGNNSFFKSRSKKEYFWIMTHQQTCLWISITECFTSGLEEGFFFFLMKQSLQMMLKSFDLQISRENKKLKEAHNMNRKKIQVKSYN